MNLSVNSKLPHEETSIFSKMTSLAREYNAINLSQGFPNFKTDVHLQELVCKAIRQGHNQYAPLPGLLELREEIVKKVFTLHRKSYDAEREVTITNGATQALFAAITAFVHPGDEVILFKPAYDSYEPCVKLNGGIPVPVALGEGDFLIDWEKLSCVISSRTRMIILNTPHNPSGKVVSKDDMTRLEELLKNTNIILLSDEVYEHIIFDEHQHHSASGFPGLADRAVICASFGKTFHNTGWKMGYCVAPDYLMKEIRKVHMVNIFCVNHPMQVAFAEYLQDPQHYLEIRRFYQEKRDYFLQLISNSRFKWVPSEGTYFQLLDFSAVTTESDINFAKRLVKEFGLAAIPLSGFDIKNRDRHQLRFCFAKTEETLEKAGKILSSL